MKNKKTNSISLILAVGMLYCTSSFAGTKQLIFDVNQKQNMSSFSLYFENQNDVKSRPGIRLSSVGLEGKPGNGNFTALKFADLTTDSWNLKVILQIPTGSRYSNSGIYLLYSDPKKQLSEVAIGDRSAFADALSKANQRRARFGAGPFELDYFSHELQIIAGTDASIPIENHGAAAFYGVNLGENSGEQKKFTEYDLQIGDTYEITIEARGLVTRSYLRSVAFQSQRVLISEFFNVDRNVDPVRGGSPIALLLQGFYNNGQDVKLPIFKHIELELFE